MAADQTSCLVTAIFLTTAIHVMFTTAIPKSRPVSEENGSDAEYKTISDTTGADQNPMVLKTETTEGKEPVFIEFSYSDESENHQAKTADTNRYSYRIIDSSEASAEKSVAGQVTGDSKNVKDAQEKQNPIKGSVESSGSVLHPNVRRQTELEENVPGFHNWPKHMPDHLRPLSPFDDDERVFSKAQSFTPGRQTRRDDGFVPSERFRPPPRAGPYLYPQSIIDREFRVPYN